MAATETVVKHISAIGLQPGTQNEYYVYWTFSDGKGYTDHFKYRWIYTTDSGVWYDGSSGSVQKGDLYSSTYTPPDNATIIKFQVKAIPKKYKKKVKKNKTKEVDRYTAKWSSPVERTIKTNKVPDNPSAPSTELKGNVLTATVDIYDGKTTRVEFQLIKDDGALYRSGIVNLLMNRATIQFSELPDGSKFKVRCRAYNGSIASLDWSNYSSDVYTRLSQITGDIYLEKLTKTLVKITLQYPLAGAEQYEVQYATKEEYLGTSEGQETTTELNGNYILVSVTEGSGYYFRIRGKSSKVSEDAPWSKVVHILVGSAPTAPTTWSSVSTAKIGEPVTLYWTHNSQDNSKERDAKVRLKYNIVQAEENVEVVQDIEIHNPDFDNPFAADRISNYIFDTSIFIKDTEVEWSVQTRGVDDAYGPFSATKRFKVYVVPSVTLQLFKKNNWYWNPFDFVDGNIYTADGEYTDPYGIDEPITKFPLLIEAVVEPKIQNPLEANFTIYSMQTYETVDFDGTPKYVSENEVMFSRNVAYRDIDLLVGLFHLALFPTDLHLENGMSYKLVCTVAMGSGLKATAELIFTMDLQDPALEVNAEIDYDEDLKCCYIRPFCFDEDDNLVRRVVLSVYRENFDGEFVEIGKNLNNVDQITVIDPHPTLTNVKYRLVAQFMETGGLYFFDVPPEPIEETGIIIQWDEEWKDFQIDPEYEELAEPPYTGNMLILPYNITISDSSSKDTNLVEYIGRSHPVAYYGTQVGQTASWTSEIPYYDEETIFKIRQLQRYMGKCYAREPNGAGYWANISISFSKNYNELKIPVTIEVTRVEGGA